MKFANLAALTSLLVVSSVGCASKQRYGPATWGDSPTPTVTVRNDNWLDVVVYLVRGATRFRLGTVTGTSTETFRLTEAATAGASPLRIAADPIGSRAGYVSDPIVLAPGQRLEVNVASRISGSTFSIRDR
ncbi:MAG TPA: hypothetical protein VFZ21_06955 [Gemmatimonadaceae bacterium]|jgi:hypothetical protein|nr:hypothetical protein [Gemmatimonadaceae bacterium]